MIKSLTCLPALLSVVTPKCLQCGTENARKTVIQASKLNVLFLLEQIEFPPGSTFFIFEGVQICTEETTAQNVGRTIARAALYWLRMGFSGGILR
jgi:hypothetical protein